MQAADIKNIYDFFLCMYVIDVNVIKIPHYKI